MTETLNRPPRPSSMPPRRTPPEDSPSSPLGLGAAAALWAAAAGLLCIALPVLLVWAADSRSGAGAVDAVRTAARLWLLAHGATLDLDGGRIALTPLGLLLLPVALVARFAASAARDARPAAVADARTLALCVALPYAVLALGVAVASTADDVYVSPVQSFVGAFVVALTGAVAGALRPARLWRAAWHGLSRRTQRLATACAASTALLVGAGALLVGGSLLLHLPRATDLATSADAGALGGGALLVALLTLVPNAAVWGACWLAGPGFAVGVGTAVGPFGHELGPVPAVPLLAALPTGGVPEWVAVLVLAVPVCAGWAGGRAVASELAEDGLSWLRTVVEAAAVGPVCGVVLGLLAWLSGGAVGGERLAEVGPSPVPVALAVSAAVGAGAVAGALVRRARLLS